MAKLHYLTVQDILWINLQTTKKVQHFSYAKLEEATFYQYAYGDSHELLAQAGRFLTGFLKMHPLDAGNEATAFIGMATFLAVNGVKLRLDDAEAGGWCKSARDCAETAAEALARVTEVDTHHHGDGKPDIRGAIRNVMECYPGTLAAM